MDDPIKIIHKVKNLKRQVQYNIYIFVGDIIPKNITNILEKIRLLSLFDCLTQLDKKEYLEMEKYYGVYWYNKFFISHHILMTMKDINKSKIKENELKKIYDNDWYELHITKYTELFTTIKYSYANKIKDLTERKISKTKLKDLLEQQEDMIDFKTGGNIEGTQLYNSQDGGEIEQPDEEDIISQDDEIEDLVQDDEENDEDDIYKSLDETDANVEKTKELIKNALEKNVYKHVEKNMIQFNQSKDNNMTSEILENVYEKIYITTQYLYKDDTIKNIKNKICVSIKQNEVFGKDTYFLPNYLYLWCQYNINEKVMIGQYWTIKTDLLTIDMEPNSNIRVYEELRGSLSNLKLIMKKQGRVRREDKEFDILYDYNDYMSMNEIYMVDIHNELGINYNISNEAISNVYDTYIKIYFSKIKFDEFKTIINYLNKEKTNEEDKMKDLYNTILNDLILENEIMKDIETIRYYNKKEYSKMLTHNYITHVFLRVYLKTDDKVDLYRIVENFNLSDKFPFIQYQTNDSTITYKYDDRYISNKKEILTKWFENSPYGISFKVKISDNNYMIINLIDSGRIDYKMQWKEEIEATHTDVINTYAHIKELIKKINDENDDMNFPIPEDRDFESVFINSTQKFVLNDKFNINHNDLSEFAIYFFPYISLVIEPKKREGKIKTSTSKFGTYLRYKRISNYYNKLRMERQLIYILRNYEFTDKELANELSKQYNISVESALQELNSVKEKNQNLKKARSVLKTLDLLPKRKYNGIGIDIQGKTRDNYKIKIAGARSNYQLNQILEFMNIFIYLYQQTYLQKIPERQFVLKKMEKILHIARRRNKVEEFVKEDEGENKSTRSIIRKDIQIKGVDNGQYSRACQNSGIVKRQPTAYSQNQISDLEKDGYIYNKDTKDYEKKINKNTVLKAIKIPHPTKDYVYFTCDPKENGEYMHVGFLTKGKNMFSNCMPCCFKKNQTETVDTKKIDFYNNCTGKQHSTVDVLKDIMDEKIYILQESHNIQDGRFADMGQDLDILFNKLNNLKLVIKNHYLKSSPNGYYFKYGVKNMGDRLLSAISTIYELPVSQIKDNMISTLKNDKNCQLFTSLNNGEIRLRFGTPEQYINYINNTENYHSTLIYDLLSYEKVISKHGVNIIIFKREQKKISKVLEKEHYIEDYYINCYNNENIDSLTNSSRDTIFLIEDNNVFYPIIMIIKKNDENNIELKRKFNYKNEEKNIVNKLMPLILDSYKENSIIINKYLTAKQIYNILDKTENEFQIKSQIIDTRYKVKYVITNNGTILPTKRSGSIPNVKIITNLELKDLDTTINNIEKLNKITNGKLYLNIINLVSDTKNSKTVKCVGILVESGGFIPCIEVELDINKYKYYVKYVANDEKIDKAIVNNIVKDDIRKNEISKENFYKEMYELFRLHFSNYLTKTQEGKDIRIKIEKIIDSKLNSKEIRQKLLKLILTITDKKLLKYLDMKGGDSWIKINNKEPDIINYVPLNKRSVCYHQKETGCNSLIHCKWGNNRCNFVLKEEHVLDYINRITEELIDNKIKASEILNREGYYVSDIRDKTKFTQSEHQKIIRSSNMSINKILETLFENEKLPQIGKRLIRNLNTKGTINLNEEHPLINMKDWYIQTVSNDSIYLYRAVANCFYWLYNNSLEIIDRNLGFIDEIQTDLANFFHGQVLKYIIDNNLKQNDMSVEIDVLSKIINIPIYVYGENETLIKKYNEEKKDLFNSIHIKFIYYMEKNKPDVIEALYLK